MVRIRTILILALAACGKSAGPAEEAPPAPAPATAPTAAPTPAPASPTPATPAADGLPPLDDLPALDFTLPDRKQVAAATKLNKEGLELHKAKDFAKAIEKYRAALAADPGNLAARYNLACAWNLAGDTPRGLAVLAQLKTNGCRACLAQLIRSRTDADWADQLQHPKYLAITGDVTLEPTNLVQVAEQIARFDGKLEGVEPYFHPRSPVKIVVEKDTERSFIGAAELARWETESIASRKLNFLSAEKAECAKLCCTFPDREVPPDSTTIYLSEICFEQHGGVAFVAKLVFDDFRSDGP